MAWVTLTNLATGQLVTETHMDDIRGNIEYLGALLAGDQALSTLGTPGSILPSGLIAAYGGAAAPTGWLLCYGQAVSRATYAALFAAIGTAFGTGDGTTTFNLPDLRGRLPLGKDNMGGASANRVTDTQADNIGQASGAETVTLALTEAPAHSHTPSDNTYNFYTNKGSGANSIAAGSLTFLGQATTDSKGGGGAHANVQPYQTVMYMVKT